MRSECGRIFYGRLVGSVMMQKLLTKYGLMAHVACVVAYPLFYLAHGRVFGFTALLWLSLAVVEMMVLLPSVRRGETLSDARLRVMRGVLWDPFFYTGLAVVGVALVQWLNSGCGLVYLADADVWQMSNPPVTWAPFCVEARAGSAMVAVFTACVTVGVALRAALGKSAKRQLLQWLAGLGGLFAVYAVAQAGLGRLPYAALVMDAGGAAMGTFFGFWALLGMGLFVDALARCQRRSKFLLVFGVLGNLAGMLFFARAFSVYIYVFLTVVLLGYWMLYVRPHVAKQTQFKLFLGALVILGTAAVSIFFLFPQNPVLSKFVSVLRSDSFWTEFADAQKIRTAVALDIWQDHPWVGVGADGFHHFVGLSVSAKDWGSLKSGQGCVYNDCLQFLCEYGVLGAGFLLAAVVTLLVPLCYRARIAWKFGTNDENDGRPYLLRLSPVVVVGVVATSVCFFESWFSGPFRSYGVLLSWTCVMAALPAFLPARAQKHAGEN